MSKPAEFFPVPETVTFITRRNTRAITTLSARQQGRLEAEGRFPRPVRLSSAREAHVLGEVLAWNAARIAERDGDAA